MSEAALNLRKETEFKISISAFYADQPSLGQKYTDRMILCPHCPHEWTMRSLANYEFYLQPLRTLHDQEVVVIPQLPPTYTAYRALNPSFIPRREGGFWVNIRVVNWNVDPIGFNQYSSPDGKFRTKNALGWIEGIQKSGQKRLSWGMKPRVISKEGFSYGKLRSDAVTGFEDVRLFLETKRYLYFICNCTKNHPHGRGRLSLGKIHKEHHPRYVDLQPLTGYGDEETQKNWLACPMKSHLKSVEGKSSIKSQNSHAGEMDPYVGQKDGHAGEGDAYVGEENLHAGEEDACVGEGDACVGEEDAYVGEENLRAGEEDGDGLSTSEVEFIYGYAPFTRIAVDLDTSHVRPLVSQEFPFRWDYFRGSASPIPFPPTEYEGRIYPVASVLVIHQVYFKDHGGRRYLHRFIYLDDARMPTGLSRPWFLKSDSIEYVSSLLYLDAHTIGIGYGYMDAQARLAQVETETVRQMFIPLSEYA
jgi:hypothetical protein